MAIFVGGVLISLYLPIFTLGVHWDGSVVSRWSFVVGQRL